MFYSSYDDYSSDTVYAFYPEYALLRKDLYPNRGVDFNHIFEIKDRLGAIQVIDGVLEGEITEFVGSSKKIPAQINLIDQNRGIVEIKIDAADLNGLRRNIYPYQIRAIDGDRTSLLSHGLIVFVE